MLTLTLIAACGGRSAPASPSVANSAPSVAPAAPPSEAFDRDAAEDVVHACEAAPVLRSPQRSKPAVLTAKRPYLVVRYFVPDRDLDSAKGEGEIGVRGSSRTFDVEVIELRTKKIVWSQGMGRCFGNAIRPPRTGELCLVFRYDDDPSARPLTFDYDFASGMHYQATDSAYEGGSADSICPNH